MPRQPTQSPIRVYVPVQEVFPDIKPTEDTLKELLSGFSRESLLCHWASLNRIQTGYGPVDADTRNRHMVEQTCTRAAIERINAFGIRRKDGYLPHVYWRGQLLELIRWSAAFGNDAPLRPQDLAIDEAKDRLLKAALIASDIWSSRTLVTLKDGAQIEQVLGNFSRVLEGNGHAPNFEFLVGRGAELFNQFMPNRYPEFEEHFSKATGLSLDAYLACSIGLSMYAMYYEGALNSVFNRNTVGTQTAFNPELAQYISLFSQTPDQLSEALWKDFDKNDFKALRERPIAALADGQTIILDPIYYIERLSIGPLFLISNLDRKNSNRVFGAFGEAFEDYANASLGRMYPTPKGLAPRIFFNTVGRDANGIEFEVDAHLIDVANNTQRVAIFEHKAAWLRESTVLNPDEFNAELLRKYGIDGDRPKGVAQLARIASAIANRIWRGANGELAQVDVIFPILLVHDIRLDTPGFTKFLNDEFQRLLGERSRGPRVTPLIILTVGDLEALESSIEHFSLCDILAQYDGTHPDRMQSLHNFLAFSDYGRKLFYNKHLSQSAEVLMDAACKRIFGEPFKPNSDDGIALPNEQRR